MASSSVVPGWGKTSVVVATGVLAGEPVGADSVAHAVPPGDSPTKETQFRTCMVRHRRMNGTGAARLQDTLCQTTLMGRGPKHTLVPDFTDSGNSWLALCPKRPDSVHAGLTSRQALVELIPHEVSVVHLAHL